MDRLIITVLISLVVVSCKQRPELNSQTVAIVGEYPIELSDFIIRYNDYLTLSLMKDNLVTRRQVAQNMINEVLLEKFDDNSELLNNSEFQKDLGWTEKQMLLGFLKDREIYAKIEASEAEIRAAFKRSSEKIAARHLYARTEEEAYRLYDALQKGAGFEQLAYDVFSDSILKNNGGFVGYFSCGEMDAAFEEEAYQMQVGQISKPVRTEQGYSIIKVEDRISQPLLTESEYQNNKNKFERLVRISKKKKAEEQYISQYFSESQLQFFAEGLDILWTLLIRNKSEDERLDPNQKVAEYLGRTFSVKEFYTPLDQIPDYHRSRIVDQESLKSVIKGHLIQAALLKEAQLLGYDKHPEVIQAQQQARRNLFLRYKRNEVIAQFTISDSLLRAYYSDHLDEFMTPRMIKVLELIVDSQAQALQLKSKVLSGFDFSDLARQNSLRSWSAARGGDLGLSSLEQFGNLKERLWQAPLNQVIGPIEIDGFWGLFIVKEKVDRQYTKFETIIREIEREYKKDHGTKIMYTYLADLHRKTKVRVNEDLIRWFPLDDPQLN